MKNLDIKFRRLSSFAFALLLTLFLLAGCGGGGVAGVGPGPGGGGDERIAESYTGPANTEYGCFYGQPSRGKGGQVWLGDGRRVTKVGYWPYKTTSSPPTSFVAEIRATSLQFVNGQWAYVPVGPVLGTSNPVTTASLSASAVKQYWIFATPVPTDGVTHYCALMREVNGTNNVGEGLIFKANTNPDSDPNGELLLFAVDGSIQITKNDALFEIWTRP